MATQNTVVADTQSESFPEYQGKIQDLYIEGYDPVSYGAPHSSLLRHSTWVAMGFLLASLFGMGLVIWGAGGTLFGFGASENISQKLLIFGAIEAVITLVVGTVLIIRGRRNYKQYRAETGRVN